MAEMKKLVDEVVDLLSWSSSCEAPPRGSWVSIVIIINHIMRSTYWLYIYTQSPRMGSWVGWDMPLVTGGDRPGRPGGWWDRVEKPSRHGAGAVLLEVGWDMPLADAPVTGGGQAWSPRRVVGHSWMGGAGAVRHGDATRWSSPPRWRHPLAGGPRWQVSVFGTVFGEKDDFKVRFGQKTSFFLSNMGANRFPKILVFLVRFCC